MNEMKNPIAMPSAEYIPVAETAKLIRKALAKAFPGQKFGVRSKSYAGGASINVFYVGGPAHHLVEEIAKAFEGSRFDGMIDGSCSVKAWMAEDGSVSHAHSPGTVGSMGVYEASFGDPHAAGCKFVHFGADCVFVRRECTKAEYWAAVAEFEKETGHQVCHEIWGRERNLVDCHAFRSVANGYEIPNWKIEELVYHRLAAAGREMEPEEIAERAKYIPA